jgi:hypothetical protein
VASYTFSTIEIAAKLGLATSSGRPHHRLVYAVLSDIGVRPVSKVGHQPFYDKSVIKMVRNWFLHEVGINFGAPVRVGRKQFVVRYLPEDGGLDLSHLDIEIVA